jgi:hypothetical protein
MRPGLIGGVAALDLMHSRRRGDRLAGELQMARYFFEDFLKVS